MRLLLLFRLITIQHDITTAAAGTQIDQNAPLRGEAPFRKEEATARSLERKISRPMLIHRTKSPRFPTWESNGQGEGRPHVSESDGEKEDDEEEEEEEEDEGGD